VLWDIIFSGYFAGCYHQKNDYNGKMARKDVLCSDKTGTLTLNKLSVVIDFN
jgi:cation transport ATPase